ncbi:Arabinose 5-phosphate isomerase KdsD [bioreactor metagenome]|uniref:Arabinose 5-phosphate isomerase KdsD n=1 Tax=bioreactor metagenome TaxID=1076179 RepID=A0A645C5P8_9ZZZZ
MGVVDSSDIVILISKGGKTDELIGMLKSLKAISPTIIVVSENNSSPMVGVADIWIKIPILQEPDSFNMLATSSTLATIAFFDALIIFIKEWSGFTKEDFLLVHPGGAVGERLIHDISK